VSVVDDWSPLDETCQPIRDRLTVIVQWYDDFWHEYLAGAAHEVARLMAAISELDEQLCDCQDGEPVDIIAPAPALPILVQVPLLTPVEYVTVQTRDELPQILVSGDNAMSALYPIELCVPARVSAPVVVPAAIQTAGPAPIIAAPTTTLATVLAPTVMPVSVAAPPTVVEPAAEVSIMNSLAAIARGIGATVADVLITGVSLGAGAPGNEVRV